MKTRLAGQSSTLVILFLVGLLGEVDYQIIPPLLSLLATTFQVDPGYAGRAVPLYSLSAGIFSILFGSLSDVFGRKPFILYGLVGFSAAAFFCYLADSIGLFFLARFFTGMTTGALSPSVTSYAADFFQYEQRGRAMGVLSGAYFAAALVGVPVVTLVAGSWGWRLIFLINSGIALCVALLVSRSIKIEPNSVYPEPMVPSRLSFGQIRHALLVCLSRRDLLGIFLASLLSSGGIVGFITYLGSYLSQQLQVPIPRVGIIFLWCGLASLIGAPLAGILSDRWGKKPILVVSGITLAVCFLVIPNLARNAWLFSSLALAGLATAFRVAPLLALMTELVTPKERGTLLALRSTLSQLGIAGATLISSYCYLYSGYRAVGSFTAALIVLSTLLVLLWVKEPNQRPAA